MVCLGYRRVMIPTLVKMVFGRLKLILMLVVCPLTFPPYECSVCVVLKRTLFWCRYCLRMWCPVRLRMNGPGSGEWVCYNVLLLLTITCWNSIPTLSLRLCGKPRWYEGQMWLLLMLAIPVMMTASLVLMER